MRNHIPFTTTVDVDVEIPVEDLIAEMDDEQIEKLCEEYLQDKAGDDFLPGLADFAVLADRMTTFHGVDWLNRWLADVALEVRRTA